MTHPLPSIFADSTRPRRRGPSWVLAVSVLAAACGGGPKPATEPAPAVRRPVPPMMALSTAPLAGQQVAVLPLTLLVPTDSLSDLPPFDDHAHALLWADSIIGATLASRGPEVRWIFPPELRKIAHRSAGMVVDPDHMGQGIMRAPNLKIVPDPFRVSLRGLVALSGGRYAFIPAAMAYSREADGTLRAEISLVLADSRSGAVSWRTLATGFGPTPVRALTSALDKVFPLSLGFR